MILAGSRPIPRTQNTSELCFTNSVMHWAYYTNISIPRPTSLDRPAVYEYYKRTQGWDEAKVNQSVFKKYSETRDKSH